MKNGKLKMVLMLSMLLLHPISFGIDNSSYSPYSTDIVKVIKNFKDSLMPVVNKTNNASIMTNDILFQFYIAAHDSNGNIIKDKDGSPLSIFEMEMKKLFGFGQAGTNSSDGSGSIVSSTADISNIKKENDLLKKGKDVKEPSNSPFFNSNVINILTIYERAQNSINKLISSAASYSGEGMAKISADRAALLVQPIEDSSNNIVINNSQKNMTILGVPVSNVSQGSQFGSLTYYSNDTSSETENTNNNQTALLSFSDLIGPNGYSDDELNRAKLFVNQILQTIPIPPAFHIPDSNNKDLVQQDENQHNIINFYIPFTNTSNGAPYSVVAIRTDGGSCSSNDQSCVEYNEMINFLSGNNLYQTYKEKYRSEIAKRSIYLEPIIRTIQERVKPKNQDKSLIEKENDMALSGLTKQYYDGLATKSAADINIEIIYTLNKAVYFLNKLHQDIQRLEILNAFGGIQTQLQSIIDIQNYVKPINNMIINRCWDPKLDPANGGIDDSNQRSQFCQNPTQNPQQGAGQ